MGDIGRVIEIITVAPVEIPVPQPEVPIETPVEEPVPA